MNYNGSNDSAARPLSDVHYQPANTSERYAYDGAPKKKTSKWLKFGLPLLLLVIAGAVVGGVLGARASKNNNSSSSSSSGGTVGNGVEGAPDSPDEIDELGRLATGTNSYWQPLYPSTTSAAFYSEPSIIGGNIEDLHWPADDFNPGTPSLTNLRPHPRIIAPQYKWDALDRLKEKNPYLTGWHETIMGNATTYANLPAVVYFMDGDSGILDVAREVKNRVKHFAYAYRSTGDASWVESTWRELENAMGWGTEADRWNAGHFLDTAELTAAFGIAYDWLHEQWSDDRRTTIREAIIANGLSLGQQVYAGTATYGWWTGVNGNWNCVCNGGMILGALAIIGDDDSGVAASVLASAVENAGLNCVRGPSTDGTWSETPNYWYFGATGHAEIASALMTATGGGDFGLLNNNPDFHLTGFFHIYVTGMTSLFDYGDHGPNKFTATANCVLFYGDVYDEPVYTLYQRDRADAAEPWSMFWLDPSMTGAWWNGLPLDRIFNDPHDNWVSFRTSWTDINGAFIALKAGALLDHQTHGDLDAGTFVIDAIGQRWAGEHGSANYLNPGYFSDEAQGSVRWTLYRTMTEGQNVITVNGQNQLVAAQPTIRADTSGTEQGSGTVFEVPSDSSAFVVADLSTAYDANIKRGLRFINGRRQILLRDELVDVAEASQWRMQTNATIEIDSPTSVTLSLGGETLKVEILNAPEGVEFSDVPAARTDLAPPLADGLADESNSPARVLAISIPAGTHTVEVLFNPQWPNFDSFVTPPSVALDDWSLDSHN